MKKQSCASCAQFRSIHKTNDIYKDIAENVETRFNTSNYEIECNSIAIPLHKRKDEKVIRLMKDELEGKIITKFAGPRAKTYSYLIGDISENKKKNKRHKKVYKKKKQLKFENYKNCLEATQIENNLNCPKNNKIDADSIKENHKEFTKSKAILKIQQRFKSERHNIFTEEINKIALSSTNDKRMQSVDRNICTWNKQRFSR